MFDTTVLLVAAALDPVLEVERAAAE